jgi:pimeloyl-ACP methyl ester carboxylesterase
VRYIYLHGFASSPRSRKATAFAHAFAERGPTLEIPELDAGSFEKLTISGQLRLINELAGTSPCVMLGSSMGGYLAALYAAEHPAVQRMVLLAPAFGLGGRWTQLVGADQMSTWKQTGELGLFHYGQQTTKSVHYELVEDSKLHPEFPDAPQPALIFHGVLDEVVPVSLSRTFASAHPRATLQEMDSDHELLDVLDTVLRQAVPFALGEPLGT